MGTRQVSNSEVGSWNTCKNKYRYEHDMGLQPREHSAALNLGTAVHALLERYYAARIAGNNHRQSVEATHEYLMVLVERDAMTAQKANGLVLGYLAFYENDVWRPVASEKEYQIPLTPEFTYTAKVDLVVEDTSDMGRLKVVDHKTTYDFWNEDDLTLNAQLPKYIGAVRFSGLEIHSAVINQLRTREVKTLKYQRLPITYNDTVIRQALQEQIIASQQIVEFRNQPKPVRDRLAIRSINKMTCKFCGVRSLCTAEWNGSDIGYLIQQDYELNSYDRNNAERVAAANKTEEW